MKLSISLQLLDLGESVGLLGRVVSSSHLYTNTEKRTHNTDTKHALSRIRTHGPDVRASEESSCIRPLGCRDLRDCYNYCVEICCQDVTSED
jgi:hypothetical protein